jgi:hypothetical protein
VLDFFGTPLVIQLAAGQRASDAGLLLSRQSMAQTVVWLGIGSHVEYAKLLEQV